METKKVLEVAANYKIHKVSDFIIPSILCEMLKIPLIGNYERVKELFEKKDEKIILYYIKRIRNYKGIYKRYVQVQESHNIVPLAFRNELAKQLAGGSSTSTFEANYIALGTNATEPNETNTQLGTEIVRGLFTKRGYEENTAYLDKFFGTSEVAGQNLREIGIFVDGTAGINTGTLLSHVNINENMSPNETLTINAEITIKSAT